MIWSQKHVHPPLVSVWFSFVEFHIHIPCLIKNIQFWDSSPWLIWNLPPILKLSGSKSKLGRVDCRQRTTNILIFNNLENWYNLTASCPPWTYGLWRDCKKETHILKQFSFINFEVGPPTLIVSSELQPRLINSFAWPKDSNIILTKCLHFRICLCSWTKPRP